MSLKDKMERELGIPIRLRAGAPGSLRVLLNGEAIYSKKDSGRAPDVDAIIHSIREKTSPA